MLRRERERKFLLFLELAPHFAVTVKSMFIERKKAKKKKKKKRESFKKKIESVAHSNCVCLNFFACFLKENEKECKDRLKLIELDHLFVTNFWRAIV